MCYRSMSRAVSPIRAWTIACLLFAAGFINYFDRAIVSVALPVIGVDLHLGPSAKGVLLSAFFWSYAWMQLPAGWAADRLNLRWLYAAAFALWSLACGFTALAATLGVLLVMRVLLGIGESIYVPGGVKIVSMLFGPRQRGLAAGLMNCGTRAGLAIGAPLIAFLVHGYGWHATFAILGFGSLIWIVPWIAVFPGWLGRQDTRPAPGLGRTLRALDRNLLGLCFGHIAYSYYWYLLVTWLPDYLVESRHMTLERAGAYTAIPFLVYAASEPLGGWIADRLIWLGYGELRARKIVVTAAFLSSVMLLAAGKTGNDQAAVAAIGAASLVGLATGNLYSLLAGISPEGEVGTWMGILNFAGNLSGVAAPLITGWLIERTNSYYPGFVVAVIVLNLGLPAYWWMVREKKEALRPAEVR
ncbi:MAG TPA: MFS transporter [Candidatus Sulfopaludibacter sp.]|nr:MFS transporter [Candidatus Sulfopaludibacter sp.]